MSKATVFKLAMMTGLSVSTIIPVAAAQAQAAGTMSFAIRGGELRMVLKTFATQSGTRLLFRTRDVQGLRSAGLTGTYTRAQALQALLAGTGLSVRSDRSGALAIVRASGARIEQISAPVRGSASRCFRSVEWQAISSIAVVFDWRTRTMSP